jgi:hypothetical protein
MYALGLDAYIPLSPGYGNEISSDRSNIDSANVTVFNSRCVNTGPATTNGDMLRLGIGENICSTQS